MTSPVIIEPFSLMGDTVAGETASEVAVNFAACLRLAIRNRYKLRRPVPDLHQVFAGHKLNPAAKEACRWSMRELARFVAKPEPKPQEEPAHV